MRKLAAIGIFALGLAFAAGTVDKTKPAAEPGITRDQADAILDELRQIRNCSRRTQHRPPRDRWMPTAKSAEDRQVTRFGQQERAATMVEFTDYQCGFCQRFHTTTFPEIRKKFVDTGKVRFVSRDLPLDFHSNAFRAAQAARCAGEQGKFWEMRDALVANPAKLAPADLDGYATGLKLDLQAFQSCVTGGKYAAEVKSDQATAASLRIDGTPAFVIGKSTSEGVEGQVVIGALPFDAFEAKFEEAAQ